MRQAKRGWGQNLKPDSYSPPREEGWLREAQTGWWLTSHVQTDYCEQPPRPPSASTPPHEEGSKNQALSFVRSKTSVEHGLEGIGIRETVIAARLDQCGLGRAAGSQEFLALFKRDDLVIAGMQDD